MVLVIKSFLKLSPYKILSITPSMTSEYLISSPLLSLMQSKGKSSSLAISTVLSFKNRSPFLQKTAMPAIFAEASDFTTLIWSSSCIGLPSFPWKDVKTS